MSQGYGHKAFVGFGEESTYAQAAAATVFPEIESESMKGKRLPIISPVLGTLSRRRTTKDKAEVNGAVKFPMMWNGLEKLWKHAFGLSSVNTTGAGPYTHTYTLKAALPIGLTLDVNRDAAALGVGTMFRYVGCHVNKLTLSQDIGQPLNCEMEFIGSQFGNQPISTATPPTFDPIEYGQMTLADMDTPNTNLLVRKWSLSIDNKLEPIHRLTGFSSFGSHRADRREVMFECEIELTDLTVFAKLRDALTDDFTFKWLKDANTDLTITLPKCFLDGEEPETSGPGPYYFTVKGQALMNAADNDELTLVLKNQTVGPV